MNEDLKVRKYGQGTVYLRLAGLKSRRGGGNGKWSLKNRVIMVVVAELEMGG